jgi:decaprenyl-phosphate phosphoribosyltransferase
MEQYIKLLRIRQYTKNLFIFLPLFFALKIFDWPLFEKAIIAFIGFCFVASSIYIINDLKDKAEDAIHPVKKFRAIASGKVSSKTALIIMAILLVMGLAIQAYVGLSVLLLTAGYFVLNVAYSFGLKKVAIIDVFIIAIGFTIRIFVGGSATGVYLSPWIVVMTFLLALFMALGKRRDDFNLTEQLGVKMRKSVDGYTIKLLDYSMVLMAAVTLVSYLLYTLSAEVDLKFNTNELYYTTIFVLLGIMRYMQITFVDGKSGSPTEILLKDRIIQISIIGWIILFGLLIYL